MCSSSKSDELRKPLTAKISYSKKRRLDIKRRKMIKDDIADLGHKEMIKNVATKTSISYSIKDDPRDSLKKDEKAELVKEEKEKKPMEHYKRMQCWEISKRMIEGRNEKALKEIEAKLGLYSSPDEFANDMRVIFSNGLMLHSPRDHVFKTARKFSHAFEYRWRSLKKEWALKENIMNKIHHNNMRRVSLKRS